MFNGIQVLNQICQQMIMHYCNTLHFLHMPENIQHKTSHFIYEKTLQLCAKKKKNVETIYSEIL